MGDQAGTALPGIRASLRVRLQPAGSCNWLKLGISCAEVPTVVRDILYGWARGFVAVAMASVWKPQTFTQEAWQLPDGWVALCRDAIVFKRPSCLPS